MFRRRLRPSGNNWGLLGSLGCEGSPLEAAPINPMRDAFEGLFNESKWSIWDDMEAPYRQGPF